ncbi:LytTR family DNA-binding domain-containing protein [Flavobacterium sp.]|uniref:LytR/AlgR family response regulator transcription factor n=1 Tax=Flavobacterium sp. TaxID=239 RepID=UPI00120EE101|nr:LytTR family DNA-binding domain-containing protein [Flavobacterium sp.]RZJ71116.1 MAG: response regulator transcription factor [Flavobacterium sp.]
MIRTAVIVEDEIPSAQRLERLLVSRGFTVVAMFSSAAKLKLFLHENLHPEWLFLDIELRDGTVFEALGSIAPKSRIIFTTAYEDRALEAFRHGGMDYLLKPIDETKLDSAIEKIEKLGNLLKPEILVIEAKSFLVSAGKTLRKIGISQIAYFSSHDNSTFLHTQDRDYIIGKSLEKLEDELGGDFFRISRKHIVNKNFVDGIVKTEIRLKSGDQFPISRQRRREVILWLKD